jgi:hypothetical protein
MLIVREEPLVGTNHVATLLNDMTNTTDSIRFVVHAAALSWPLQLI